MTRRQIHLPTLALLFLVLGVLGISVHMLHGYQVRRGARSLLDQAHRAQAEGKWTRAADFFHRYLGYETRDTDALAEYGLTLQRVAADPDARKEWPDARERAFYALEGVLRRDESRNEIRRRLIDVAMDLGQFADAQSHLESLLLREPTRGELHHLLGVCHETQGRYPAAVEAYGRAVRYEPTKLETYLVLSDLQRTRLDQAEKAEQTMDALVKANPTEPRAHLARALFRKNLALRLPHRKKNLFEGAIADVAEARRIAPDSGEAALADADLAGLLGRQEDCIRHAARAATLAPEDVRTHLMYAEALQRTGKIPDAIQALRLALDRFRQRPDGLWRLTGMLLDLGAIEDGRAALAVLRTQDNAAVELLETKLLIYEKKWLSAIQVLERIRLRLVPVRDLSHQLQVSLGECYLRLGNPDQSQAAFRQAILLDPGSGRSRLGLGAALQASGRLEEALEEFHRAEALTPVARGEVARLLVRRNARRPVAERSWEEIHRFLDEEERVHPESVEVLLIRADVLALQGDLSGARQLLEKRVRGNSGFADAWIALAGIAEAQGDREGALRTLDKAVEQLGQTLPLVEARLAYWIRRGGSEALVGLEEGLGLAAQLPDPTESDRARVRVAEGYFRIGKKEQAVQLLERLASGPLKNDLPIHQSLFDMVLQGGDVPAAQREVQELRRVEGEEGAAWRFAEAAVATLSVRQGDKTSVTMARTRLSEAAARRPGWSRIPLLEAQLDDLTGQTDKALEGYLKAIELGDLQPDVTRRVLQMLHERRRFAEADALLRRLPETFLGVSGLHRLAAEAALGQDTKRALALAKNAVPADSQDYRDHLWIGQVAAAAGNLSEAEASLRKALSLGGTSSTPWVVLGQFFVRTGRVAEAVTLAERAENERSAEGGVLTSAILWEVVGKRERAEVSYQSALKATPEKAEVLRAYAEFHLRTRQPARAEPLLRRLLEPSQKCTEEDRIWARRSLASALVGLGDLNRVAEALGLLDTNLKHGKASAEDRSVRATLLSMIPTRRREGLKLLEELAAEKSLTPEYQLFLARLYEMERDWPRAREQWLGLLGSIGDVPEALASYAEALLRRGELEEAEAWIRRLMRAESGVFRGIALQARLLKAKGQSPQAASLVRDHARGLPSDLVRCAGLLGQLGEDSSAEELYRQGAERFQRPSLLLAAAVHLAHQDRALEALDLCDRVRGRCDSEEVAAAGVAIAFAATLEPALLQRVEGWLEAARKERPQSRDLLFTMANFRFVQGKNRDASDLYKALSEAVPTDRTILNNWAWLQALGENRPDLARALVNRALERFGAMADLLDTSGVVALAAGQPKEAIPFLEEALRISPSPEAAFHLAQAQLAINNRQAAREALSQARRLGLRPSGLHPLERKAYRRVLAEVEGS